MATITYTIDATDKTFGHVASAAAKALMGKNTPDYVPNKVADVRVYIKNASKTKMSVRRMNETLHESYSGYPGGQKFTTNAQIVGKKAGWVFMNSLLQECYPQINCDHL